MKIQLGWGVPQIGWRGTVEEALKRFGPRLIRTRIRFIRDSSELARFGETSTVTVIDVYETGVEGKNQYGPAFLAWINERQEFPPNYAIASVELEIVADR